MTYLLDLTADLLQSFLTHFTYLALMVVLVVTGMGLPIPEDIPLVTAGYLCHPTESPIAKENLADDNNDGSLDNPYRRVPRLWLMVLSGMIGVLAGDTMVFHIGRKGIGGENVVCRHIRKVMHSRRREKVERHFAKHGGLTVFAGRFMPGFRSLIFAFAGMSRMSYPRFLVIDGLAAAISVPLFIGVGFKFAEHINVVVKWIDKIKLILLPVVLVAAGVAVFIYIRHRRQQPVIDQL